MTSLAESQGRHPGDHRAWWLRRHPARIAPVIGTSNPRRIRARRDAATGEPDRRASRT
ncbi:hypothetical protein ACFU51_26705 [Streptomyces sp. NPDC057430]|uniref:hypothetical protein n=1 Tax=Streptomyces sp. NPDC057430 TaxID=3346131 RepID=UPI00367EE58A